MRPINLIPPEERRARDGASRTGPIAFVLVGALALLLIGVVMVVSASNDISDREAEVGKLEAQKAEAVAAAEELAPYASFQQVAEARTETVSGLADSRFDWARMIRELSLILPSGVYLSSLTGSAGGGGESEVSGPSLTLSGCAPGQEGVAVFVSALKEIDGVTRVGLQNSALAEGEGGETAAGGFCQVGNKALFDILVAFDAAPPSPNGAEGAVELPGEEEAGEEEGEEGEEDEAGDEATGEAEGGEAAAVVGGEATG
ncbi:MAG TPA: PilN domain-containing protein [Solirubrobacterales bacterium]|nr:PilN domain-containing protein [Solirubrobacterales bacterium]